MLELATGLQQGDPNNQVKQVRFDFGEFPPGKLDYMSVIEFFSCTHHPRRKGSQNWLFGPLLFF